jgi:hypothetical protein
LGFGAPEPGERRTARRLAALVVGVMCTLEASHVTGVVDPWPMVAWGEQLDMPWRRIRVAVDRLAEAGLATVTTAPFRPSAVLLPRGKWVHQRGGDDRFVQLSGAAVRALVAEHGLEWRELGVLLGLVFLADDRDWHVSGQTLTRLGEVLGVGYRTLVAALEVLADRGLVIWQARRGQLCALAVPAGAAMVVLPAPGRARHRSERRELARQTAHGEGPAVAVARKVMLSTRSGIDVPPSPTLTGLLADLMARADAATIESRLVAMGSLAGSRDAMAVLVDRARRLLVEMDVRADTAARERQAQAQAVAADQAARRAARDAEDRSAGESRWLGQIFDDDTMRKLRDAYAGGRPLGERVVVPAMAADIAAAARSAVAQHPTMAPEDAAREHALEFMAIDMGPGGADLAVALPQVRAGPSLVDRLRRLI